MRLVDVLGAAPTSPYRTGKVVSQEVGTVTVQLNGQAVPLVRYLLPVPAVGSVVLVVYVYDQPVCLGAFA
jgi:hypothetical protein